MTIEIHPLTHDRWADFETLFGPRGACYGCWCMYWLIPRKEFEGNKNAGNKAAIKARIGSGFIPGLLAYQDGSPIGWVAVGPRQQYLLLERSRVLARVDDLPVWSIVCFFISPKARHQGLTQTLIKAAEEYARSHGADMIEAYPMDPQSKRNDASIYLGTASTFNKMGYEEVIRRSPTHPVMRKKLG